MDTVATVGSVEELNETRPDSTSRQWSGSQTASPRWTVAVVESYSDVARPLQAGRFDAVAVVEPGRARLYDGDRYRRACEVATGSPQDGQLEERVEHVVDLLDPEHRVALPPLGIEGLSDPERIAAAYEPAYDALLSVADWT